MTSRIPNFAEIPLAGESLAIAAPALGEPWMTPEGIPVKGRYGPEDREGIEFLDTYPGLAPFLRGPYPTMAHRWRPRLPRRRSWRTTATRPAGPG